MSISYFSFSSPSLGSSFRNSLIVTSLLMILGTSLTHAEPRSYPEEVFNDPTLLRDIRQAQRQGVDISDATLLAQEFPNRSFARL